VYALPSTPAVAMIADAVTTPRQGALRIAAFRSTAQKWTMVGVPKARVVMEVAGASISAPSTITTNCRPVSAAADEPTIT
jgi:hypothetical protein